MWSGSPTSVQGLHRKNQKSCAPCANWLQAHTEVEQPLAPPCCWPQTRSPWHVRYSPPWKFPQMPSWPRSPRECEIWGVNSLPPWPFAAAPWRWRVLVFGSQQRSERTCCSFLALTELLEWNSIAESALKCCFTGTNRTRPHQLDVVSVNNNFNHPIVAHPFLPSCIKGTCRFFSFPPRFSCGLWPHCLKLFIVKGPTHEGRKSRNGTWTVWRGMILHLQKREMHCYASAWGGEFLSWGKSLSIIYIYVYIYVCMSYIYIFRYTLRLCPWPTANLMSAIRDLSLSLHRRLNESSRWLKASQGPKQEGTSQQASVVTSCFISLLHATGKTEISTTIYVH